MPQQQQSGQRPNTQQPSRPNGDNRCFTCRSPAHFARNCPRNQKPAQGQNTSQNNQGKEKKQVMQVRQWKINFTTLAELLEGVPIMMGTFSIDHKPAIIFFDSGATHSFISDKFGARLGLNSNPTKAPYLITTPGGRIASNQILRRVPIQLGSKLIKTDLISFSLDGMDVILGMDWMTQYNVLLDISSRSIEINSPYQGTTTLYLSPQEYTTPCTFAMKDVKLEDIPVVCEFADVFPDDLPGLPSKRDIEFVIEQCWRSLSIHFIIQLGVVLVNSSG